MIELALRHRFRDRTFDMAFVAPTPGVTVLFGASGSGKTTCIATIAGLLRPDEARVSVDGVLLCDTAQGVWVPTERRRLGMVFQAPRLFPHLSVANNLRYGQRRAPPGGLGITEIVELLGLESLLKRRPHTLSGGERQRAAIGRALLANPRVLLMDEPLASLDAPRKAEILPYLARLRSSLALPIVYVTHSMDEVLALGDTLVLIEAGHTVAVGSLAELAARPDLPLLAGRDDAGAVLSCIVAEHDPSRRLTLMRCAALPLWVPLQTAPVGSDLRVRIPAREVILATEAPSAVSVHNVIAGRVNAITDDAERQAVMVSIATEESTLLARITPDAVEHLCLAPGTPVIALIKSVSIDVLST